MSGESRNLKNSVSGRKARIISNRAASREEVLRDTKQQIPLVAWNLGYIITAVSLIYWLKPTITETIVILWCFQFIQYVYRHASREGPDKETLTRFMKGLLLTALWISFMYWLYGFMGAWSVLGLLFIALVTAGYIIYSRWAAYKWAVASCVKYITGEYPTWYKRGGLE